MSLFACFFLGCLCLRNSSVGRHGGHLLGGAGQAVHTIVYRIQQRQSRAGRCRVVDGGPLNGGIVVQGDDSGTVANPVVIRWNRAVGGTRPLLQGGQHTIKFEQSNNVVFEGFEVTGGSSTCVFSEADNVTVRDSADPGLSVARHSGADQNSGSFTLEYSEIRNSGAGTTRHSIYMQSDEVSFPGRSVPDALQLRA